MKIWNIAIKQPVLISMVLLAGIVMGIFSYMHMPQDLFPDIDFPVVVVNTIYPGAGPDEVEDQVTSVIEDQLVTLSGLDEINSTSAESVSTIILQFDMGLSADDLTQDVQEAVGLIRNDLPSDIYEPVVQSFDPTEIPVMTFSVADTSGAYTQVELRDFADDEIKARLEQIPNVSAVDVTGGQVREIKIDLDTKALQSLRIAPEQVAAALQLANINLPGGTVKDGGTEYLVRTPANLQTVTDVGNVIISERASPIYLRDIAAVRDDFEAQDTITRLNGEDAIVLDVRKTSGSNTLEVANAVKEELDAISNEYTQMDIAITSDQSIQIQEGTRGAVEDLLYATIIAVFVLFAFFRDVRKTLLTIAGLPVIMIITLFFMDLFGITLNQISLLALALVIGLVIDDGIVVRENIIRWIEKGFSPRMAASLGTAEVAAPVFAITAVILAVFLPVSFMEGIIGQMAKDFGLTVSIAVAVSYVEAMTLAPMLSAYFFKGEPNAVDVADLRELDDLDGTDYDIGSELDDQSNSSGLLGRTYGTFLDWVLRHRLVSGAIATIILAASFYSITLTEMTFMPSMDATEFQISVSFPGGTPIETSAQEATQIENIIVQHPAVDDVVTTIGGRGTPENVSFMVALKDDISDDITADVVIEELRGPLADAPNIIFSALESTAMASHDITVDVIGSNKTDFYELGRQADIVEAQMAAIPGLTDISVSFKEGRPEMQIEVDRRKASDLGLSPAQVASTIRLMINGDVATTFRGDGSEADIRVQLSENDRASIDDILNISILSQTGQLVPLHSVASIIEAESPNAITKMDRRQSVSVMANVAESQITLPDATSKVEEMIEGLDMPDGTVVQMGGTIDMQNESLGTFLQTMILGIIFVFMILASQFASITQPLIIMIAMPLAIAGGILSLVLTGRPLEITGMIGFIFLMGLVVKNSVLLVDFANQAHKRGVSASDAMRIAGPIRLRPILMTALSMILAMVPIAIGISAGGEFRQPMAIVIIGGMVVSTFLTLFIVPLAYTAIVGLQDSIRERRRARTQERGKTASERNASFGANPDIAHEVITSASGLAD